MKIIDYKTLPNWMCAISKKEIESDKYQEILMMMTRYTITKYITDIYVLHSHDICPYNNSYTLAISKHLTYKNAMKIVKEVGDRFKIGDVYTDNGFIELLCDYDYKKHGKIERIDIKLYND